MDYKWFAAWVGAGAPLMIFARNEEEAASQFAKEIGTYAHQGRKIYISRVSNVISYTVGVREDAVTLPSK